MKKNEKDYLDQLFASSADQTDENATDIPQVDFPDGLNQRLRSIADAAPVSAAGTPRKSNVIAFPTFAGRFAGIAASLFAVVISFQFYQQHQTLKSLAQAQADLATALHYLGEANRIARSQVVSSINENIQNAGVKPAIEIGRETLRDSTEPPSQQLSPQRSQDDDLETRTQTHSL